MAKHGKKDAKKKDDRKDDAKAAKKAAKKAAERAEKEQVKVTEQAAKQAKADAKAAKQAKDGATTPTAQAGAATATDVDQVHVLRRALRETEARLTETEAALHRAQQELAAERAAAADAVREPLEDAVVDAAVVETVALALDHAADGEADGAVAALRVADELDAAVAAADVADPVERHGDSAEEAARVFTAPQPSVTTAPPEPVATAQRADDEPNESWTLIRLRSEAKRRGIAGISSLTKAGLLARLRA